MTKKIHHEKTNDSAHSTTKKPVLGADPGL